MNDNDSEDITFIYNNNNLSYNNIRYAFDKLLGPLATLSCYSKLGDSRKDYTRILKIVSKWSSEYEEKRTLIYIDHKEMLSVYYKVDELNVELLSYIDSDLTDEIVIWLWEIMLLRKKQIDNLNTDK